MSILDHLPDFESFDYHISQPPVTTTVVAWEKAKECERRLAFYDRIAATLVPSKRTPRVLIGDSVRAFLYSLVSAIEHLREQFLSEGCVHDGKAFDTWLDGLSENTLLIRGLRTIRNFEAHVEEQSVGSEIIAVIGPGGGSVTRHIRFPEINLQKSKRKQPLEPADVALWNANYSITARAEVGDVLLEALRDLRSIIAAGEKRLGQGRTP